MPTPDLDRAQCVAEDGEPCDCHKCRAEFERKAAYFKPLYDAEKRAGILPREHYTEEEWNEFEVAARENGWVAIRAVKGPNL